MNGDRASRIVSIVVGMLAAIAVGGLIVTAALGVTGEKYGNYGEVPIPGSGIVRLPAGEVIVSFHIKDHAGSGMRVPPLTMDITPPTGVSDPLVTEDLGDMVAVGDDAHRRVWFMKVATEGDYRVIADGPVADFVDPQLAFGQTRSIGAPLWFFVALSVISVDLAIAVWWFRFRRRDRGPGKPAAIADPYVPTDDGVRLEQLKTIAALRDSGALTEAEFKAEKRRILGGR
jgi:hypothetical protein